MVYISQNSRFSRHYHSSLIVHRLHCLEPVDRIVHSIDILLGPANASTGPDIEKISTSRKDHD